MFAPGSGRVIGPGVGLLVLATGVWVVLSFPYFFLILPLLLAGWTILGFVVWFFRDPERTISPGLVAPADGKIREIVRENDRWRVSIFMNVTDVHVNRFPLDAEVLEVGNAGRGYHPAYRPGAITNVQRRYALNTSVGRVEVVQITGILARRLVSFVQVGDTRAKGSRLGMIVLGSRVDVAFPAGQLTPQIQLGQHVHAGSTTLAREVP